MQVTGQRRSSTSKPSKPEAVLAGHRVAAFILLLAFLNLQGDGFRLARGQRLDQLLLLPFTAIFCALLLTLLFRPLRLPFRTAALLQASALPRTLCWLTLVALVSSMSLFFAEARYYQRFGYRLHLLAALAVFAAALLLVASNLGDRHPPSASRILLTTVSAYAAISALSFWSFPIAVDRSDMLPLLAQAGRELLSGADPYRLYSFPHETVFLTYLPGTLLSYLPAVFLHIDLRSINLVCTAALAALLAWSAKPAKRAQAAALVGLWLLSPYLLYRHEIYTAPHWLVTVAALLLVGRRRVSAGALLFGVSVALSQFSWVLLPFLLLFLWQRFGSLTALRSACLVALPALALPLPFVLPSPHAFFFGVLGHWQHQAVSARPVNLSYWIAAITGPERLLWVQLATLAAMFLYLARGKRCATFPACLRAMALALSAFLCLNLLVWGYFFLLLELLLLLYVLASNGVLAEEPSMFPA